MGKTGHVYKWLPCAVCGLRGKMIKKGAVFDDKQVYVKSMCRLCEKASNLQPKLDFESSTSEYPPHAASNHVEDKFCTHKEDFNATRTVETLIKVTGKNSSLFGEFKMDYSANAAIREENERVQVLGIFPIEIWTIILDLIDDTKTLEYLSNSSSFFRNLLKDDRVNFLAPEVLKIPAFQNCFHRSEFRYLNFRKICKSWCSGFDAIMEQQTPFSEELAHNFGNSKIYCDIERWKSHFCDYTRRTFNEHFDKTHSLTEKNPILGRSIRLTGCRMDLDALNCYGNHVWYLTILCTNPYMLYDEQVLHDILKALPYLKLLETFGNYDFPKRTLTFNHPLPRMLNLEALKAHRASSFDIQILRHNPSISFLEIRADSLVELAQLCLQNLRHLKLYFTETVKNIQYVAPETPSLALLTFKCSEFKTNEDLLIWEKLFNFINVNWGNIESLKHLEIELPRCFSLISKSKRSEIGFVGLNLKNVEKVYISMDVPHSLDYLIPLKHTLKQLRIRGSWFLLDSVTYSLYEECISQGIEHQTIQFLGWENRLLKSNIWVEFPNLNVVDFEGDLCYADQFCFMTKQFPRFPMNRPRHYTRKHWKLSKAENSKCSDLQAKNYC